MKPPRGKTAQAPLPGVSRTGRPALGWCREGWNFQTANDHEIHKPDFLTMCAKRHTATPPHAAGATPRAAVGFGQRMETAPCLLAEKASENLAGEDEETAAG